MNDELAKYYQQELIALEDAGRHFANMHPDLAPHLNFNTKHNADPQIAHLIEAVALLNARVSKKLEDEMPRMQRSLLDALYPHYETPLPSMAVISLLAQKDAKPFRVKKSALLETDPSFGPSCRLQTCYDTQVLPLKIQSAEYFPFSPQSSVQTNSSIKLSIQRLNKDISFAECLLKPLRIYIDGKNGDNFQLYESLVQHLQSIEVSGGSGRILPIDVVKLVGFDDEQSVLPRNVGSFDGYRLISEFFACPEKYMFIDIDLSSLNLSIEDDSLDIYFGFSKPVEVNSKISESNFRLNCVPVVNLFDMLLEPVQVTQQQADYPLQVDVRRPDDFTIHHINSVTLVDENNQYKRLEPLYGANKLAWYMERGQDGCKISLSDPGDELKSCGAAVLNIQAACTNANLLVEYCKQNPDLGLQFSQSVGALESISWVSPPTLNHSARLDKSELYRINTHIALNMTQLLQEDGEQIRSMLALYDRVQDSVTQRLSRAVHAIRTEQLTERVYQNGMPAFCLGLGIKFFVDTRYINSGEIWLMMKILETVLSQYSSPNSFIKVFVLDQLTERELYQWPAIVGKKPLL